ncbi:hypothetical protein NA612_23365, partial [Salmonella sp. NW378]|uniref:hypothetical protein n=1 Tax=Salmonella sp. NW378 TaxID=2947938 RepID=UPI003F424983
HEPADALRRLLEDGSLGKEIRFKAFVGLLHYHRRLHNQSPLKDMLDRYNSVFPDILLFRFYQASYRELRDSGDYVEAL